MTKKQLNQWAQMHDPAEGRKEALASEATGPANSEPCKANGVLGKFGAGSKSAGFVYGKDVRAVTCADAGRGKANIVYELLLSETEFEERSKQNPVRAGKESESWMNNVTRERDLYDESVPVTVKNFEDMRTEKSTYIHELMKSIERKRKPFTLLIVSDIKPKLQSQSALHLDGDHKHENLVNLMRDLRKSLLRTRNRKGKSTLRHLVPASVSPESNQRNAKLCV